MSITATKMMPIHATRAAEAFKELFGRDTFERWTFAGSLRRLKSEIGDIEYVVMPRVGEAVPDGAMFPERTNLVNARLDELLAEGAIEKQIKPDGRARWGERYRAIVFQGVPHEIYFADENNWGSILGIRTGPAEFMKFYMWRLNQSGVLKHAQGYIRYRSDDSIVRVPDENTFFELAHLPFMEPRWRCFWRENCGEDAKRFGGGE